MYYRFYSCYNVEIVQNRRQLLKYSTLKVIISRYTLTSTVGAVGTVEISKIY